MASFRGALPWAVVSALVVGCAARVPRPNTGPTPPSFDVEVPYPPPAARVEVLSAPKTDTEVWVDGQWEWSADEWRWRSGAWVTPPQGSAYFTPWTTIRRGDGRLFFIPASWRDASGRPIGAVDAGCSVPSVARAPMEEP
ncbi:MAG: hypothetical protein U0414_16195 [Polyangiaceae bacterium]